MRWKVLVVCFLGLTFMELSAGEIELTAEEARLVARLYKIDNYFEAMATSQKSLAALNAVAKKLTPGPTKIALDWNQALIKTWRLANQNLDKLKKLSTCEEIDRQIVDESPNVAFFRELYEARGCTKDLEPGKKVPNKPGDFRAE